jgi:hypothetical protein
MGGGPLGRRRRAEVTVVRVEYDVEREVAILVRSGYPTRHKSLRCGGKESSSRSPFDYRT